MLWLLLALLPVLSHAATLHVPADYPTIQAGVAAAVSGDTVVVADGIYSGTGNYNIDLQGKALTVTSANGPAVCIVDAQGLGRLFSIVTTSDTVVLAGFTLRNGTDADAGGAVYCLQSAVRLQDCRLEACTADWGGAVWLRHSTLAARSCTFTRCVASRKGGAISADTSVLSLTTCQFDSNLVHRMGGCDGGAISLGRGSQTEIDSCGFFRNRAWDGWGIGEQVGGAIACDSNSLLTVTTSEFIENGRPMSSGGALYSFGSTVAIGGCSFIDNGHCADFWIETQAFSATPPARQIPPILFGSWNSGGAVYLKQSLSAVHTSIFIGNGTLEGSRRWGGAAMVEKGIFAMAGCTFVGNIAARGLALFLTSADGSLDSCLFAFHTAVSGFGQLIQDDDSTESQFTITCTDSWGNDGGDWVGLMDTLADKYDNFSADPRFCRQSEGNYHLQEDSPCRPEASPCGSLVGALSVEPGCLSCCVMPGNVNAAGIVDGGDLALLVAYLTNDPGSKPPLPCPDEANVNAAGIVDGSDLALLVAYLTNAPEQKPMLPFCP